MGNHDYKGKIVYMGIDVHKKTYACVSICDGQIVKRDTMPAKPEILISYIQNTFPKGEVHTAYEAGFSGFHLHRALLKAGIKNIVIHPGSIEIACRDRVKTDKRDAKKIAIQLSVGRLRCIYIPSLEQEANRSITRLRESIVKLRHKVGQKFKSLLFTQGLIESDDERVICKKWLEAKLIEAKSSLLSEFYYSLEHYAEQWLRLTKDLNKIKKDLLEVQSKKNQALLYIYKSAPGIGDITALTLKDELGDMQQFLNEKQLFSYLGFTPVEYSSGGYTRQGHISRQGRSMLRHLFVEAAWRAITKDPDLMDIYQRTASTRGGKRAIVAIARRLAGRLRTCVRQGVLYEIRGLALPEVQRVAA
jgi:transposase